MTSYLKSHGPFDVLLGFSQGAIIITVLTALRLKAVREKGAPPPEWLLNVRRECRARMRVTVKHRGVLSSTSVCTHQVLVCGMPPRDNRYIELTTQPPIDFPCTLMFGKKDHFYSYGQRLREIYVKPDVFEHERGHEFPAGTDPLNDEWVESMRRKLGVQQRALV